MPASPLDSALYRDLFGDPELAALFTDSAEIRAMMIVEGALARCQGDRGIIPDTAAAAIHRASLELQIDPAGLAAETGRNAVPVPALVAAFRKAMEAPEHAQYLHWGATSQDILDTGLALRLRQALNLLEARLCETVQRLGVLADRHAELPMAGRTYGQHAAPTSFGAVVAGWGHPLLRWQAKLAALRAECLVVSLSGAAGTSSALGPDPEGLRSGLARALALADPGGSRHASRDAVASLGGWLTGVACALGKMGDDLWLMAQSGLDEVSLGGSGKSSTMPQKSNPVAPSLLVALARTMTGLNAALQGAALHRQQRDGGAWMTEWLVLPQMLMLTGRALIAARDLAAALTPIEERMMSNLNGNLGLIHAEAISFALCARMSRPEAQAEVATLCERAVATGEPLVALVARVHPGIDLPDLERGGDLGQAPAEARRFAAEAHALGAG